MLTPWGQADHVTHLPHGIVSVSTPSHGGYYVPPEAREKMPEAARVSPFLKNGWYEEDCDWAIVVLSFPEILDAEIHTLPAEEVLEAARATVRGWMSEEVCRAFGLVKRER